MNGRNVMKIEEPGRGRAHITDDGYALVIEILVHKGFMRIVAAIFMCAWLAGWFYGEVTVIGILLGLGPLAAADEEMGIGLGSFLSLWLIMWTLGGIVVFVVVIWFLFGKHIIVLSQGILSLTKQALIFKREKHYSTGSIKNMRLRLYANAPYSTVNKFQRRLPYGDTLSFDYGNRTVNFAAGIDEAEAKSVLDLFHKKGIHMDESFVDNMEP